MRRKRILRRIAASAVALSMMAALSAPAFAATFDISNGGLVIEANSDGSVTVWQDGCSGSSGSRSTVKSGEEIEITGSINMADSKYAPTSESLASNSEIYYPTTEKEAEEPDTEEPKTQEKAEEPAAEEQQTQEKAEEPDTEEPKTQEKADEPAAEEQQTQEKAEEPAAEEQQTQKKAEGKKEASASAEATATASAGLHSSRIRTGVIEIINNTVNKLKLTFNNVTVQQEKVAGSGGGGAAGVDVAGNGDVEIELKGKNTIKGAVGHAGIEKDVTKDASGSTITNGGGTLTITAKDTNQTLYAEGGSGGAGIGSGQYRGSAEVSNGEKVSRGTGKIVISGGKIEAVGGPGGYHGAGIGTGITLTDTDTSNFVDTDITITGDAEVTAKASGDNAIGGKYANTVITISGNAKVSAEGSYYNPYLNDIGFGIGNGNGNLNLTIKDNAKVAAVGEHGGVGSGQENAKVTVSVSDNASLDARCDKLSSDRNYVYGAGIGAKDAKDLSVTVSGSAQVTAKGGAGGSYRSSTGNYKDGAAAGAGIGTPGQFWYGDGTQPDLAAGTEAAPDTSNLTNGSVVIEPSTPPAPDHVHNWKTTGSENVDEGLVRTHYTCACGASKTELAAPRPAAPASGSSSAVTLTVTGAGAYETSMADGRYVVAVPAETAVLSGCLGNLKELKAQGVNTLVFRTQLRETALNIDSMLSLGVDDTLFTLTHNGEGASLTIGGFEHNELIH